MSPEPLKGVGPGMVSATIGSLCVTSGKVDVQDGLLHANIDGMRAVVMGGDSRSAELRFTFHGVSDETVPLANGELREQIGLKLRAQDTCNVIYVMWHIAPDSGVFVSVKSNPGMSTHAECADRGYLNLPPLATPPRVDVAAGSTHVLRADITGDVLRVVADGKLAWEGSLPSAAFAFDGPAGVRSDNGKFSFDLKVPNGPSRQDEACVTD